MTSNVYLLQVIDTRLAVTLLCNDSQLSNECQKLRLSIVVVLFDVKWPNYWGYSKNNNSYLRQIFRLKENKQNMCSVSSKEPSHCDRYLEHPKHKLRLRENKKTVHYYWAAHKDKKCEAIFHQQKQITILHLTVIFSVLLRCYVFFFFSVFSDLSVLNRIRSLFKQLI